MFAATIAVAGTVLDKGLFGSGSFFDGEKNFSKAIFISISLTLAVHENVVWLNVHALQLRRGHGG